MLVAVLFVPVVAGNIFLESEFHRLPKITGRNNKPEKRYMLFDPCDMKKAGNRNVSCAQLKRRGENMDADYYINPHDQVHVKCDMTTDGGGWTVIQRRGPHEKETQNFEKTYEIYEKGFGDAASSYWIGNMNLHILTTLPSNNQVLRIELTEKTGVKIIAEYDHFEVGSTADKYKLTIGKYNGTPGYDALTAHKGQDFWIGNEIYKRIHNCYPLRSGGWWYNACVRSNLNGKRFKSDPHKQNTKGLGITWTKDGDETPNNHYYKLVEMKIRDADFNFCMGNMAN